MRKLLLALVLAVLVGASLTACGGSKKAASAANCARPIDVIERELGDALAESTKQGSTPAGETARLRAVLLETEKTLKPCEGSPDTTVAEVANDGVPEEYKLIYYESLPGVPENYFGPACVPNGDAVKCKTDLQERIKHNPLLLSVQMRNFKLLPGWNKDLPPEKVESLRQEWQQKLTDDWQLRKEWATKVSGVLDSLQNLRIEALSGQYYTEYVSPDGKVHQARKTMDPTKHVAIVGEDQDGVTHMIKVDCGDQTVSKQPIPGTPPGELPPSEPEEPEQPEEPEEPVEKCPYNLELDLNDRRCAKQPADDVLLNPAVPPQVTGPGCPRQPVPGGPCYSDPPPAEQPVDSPTGCNGPCPGATPQTTSTTRPPSTGGGEPVVPGCGRAGQPACNNTGVTPPTPATTPPSVPQSQPPAVGGEAGYGGDQI